MNSPLVWLLILVAAAATAVALWAGPNLMVAGPAATLAVLAAGLLVAGAWLDRRDRGAPDVVLPAGGDEFLVRFGFGKGRLGREEIVTTLDKIERTGATPGLPVLPTKEMDAIVGLSGPAFREYVRRRIDDLEART
ncbi:MAG: hypothetical protein WB873_02125 [Thermoplasmata archaeon]